MSGMDSKWQKEFAARLLDIAEERHDALEDAMADAHWGRQRPDDAQFVLWVQRKVMALGPDGLPNPTYDPYWAPSLRFDEGRVGREIVRRFAKLTGIDLTSIPPPPMLAPPAPGGV